MNDKGISIRLVAFCDETGTIAKIVWVDTPLDENFALGASLEKLVHESSRNKALTMLSKVARGEIVLDWELLVEIEGNVRPLNFTMCAVEEGFLLIAHGISSEIFKLYEELTRINNEQASALRFYVKEKLKTSAAASEGDVDVPEQLMRLNRDYANAQRRLRKTNAKLERLNEEKNLAIGILAHDLRNPLNAVAIFSQLLLEDLEDAAFDQREMLELVHSSSHFMRRLIDDVLDMSQIEAGTLMLDLQPSPIFSLVDRCVTLARLSAKKKGISVELALPKEDEPPVLEVDPFKIEQVLTNLLSRAVEYSPSGSKVTVSASLAHDSLAFSVSNEGSGITQSDIDRLVPSFSSNTGRGKSAGFGLAIARRIVDGHGGQLNVRSEIGRGATLEMVLPRKNKPECRSHQRDTRERGGVAKSPDGFMHVLLADDNRTNRNVARALLERLGCSVVTVTNGKELFETWKDTDRFHLIVTDVQMPEADGLEAATAIRSKERADGRSRTPIVGLTGHSESSHRHMCFEAGMDDVITKPIDIRLLKEIVEHYFPDTSGSFG